jgi:hypothetical protein
MRTHITPTRIYTSDWEFVRSITPRRTVLGWLLLLVALAVTALVIWLAITDPVALLTIAAIGALWLMAMGARRA